MEINKTILKFIFLLIMMPLVLHSENYKGYNLPYYDKGIGGSPSGLGGAFVSIADDGNTPFYNPAGLPDIKKKILSLNYCSSFIGSENLVYVSYVYDVNPKTGLGFHFIWTGISDLQSYDESQNLKGSYNVSHVQIGMSYGRALSKKVNIGLTGKFFYHNFYSYSGNNFDLDFGFIYKILPRLKFGLALHNFIPMGYKLKDVSEDIPLTLKSGFNVYPFRIKLMFVYEVEKTILSSGGKTALVHHIGIRYSLLKYININFGYDLENFYLGLNLKLEKFLFYSGTIRNKNAGNLNFGASYIFPDKTTSGVDEEMETFYEGIVAYQSKDYRTAAKYFQKVLDKRYDPTAEYYLKNSRSFLESEEWMSEEEKVLVGMRLELAKRSISRKEYGKAISTLRDVLTINPGNEEANELIVKIKNLVAEDVNKLYQEAIALHKKDKYKDSFNKCEMALKLNPEHEPSVKLKNENDRILKELYNDEYKVKAIKDEAETLFNAGLDSFKNENWVDAINKFKKSYELIENPETKKYLESAKKQLKDAKVTLKQKKKADVHYKLGQRFYKQKKIRKAIKEYETAVNLYPDHKEAQEQLNMTREEYDNMIKTSLENGKTALRKNKLSAAIENFQKVLKIDPGNEIAKQFLTKSKSLIKDSIVLNLKLANKEYDNKNYAEALELYREVLKLDKTNTEAKKGSKKTFAKLQKEIKRIFNLGVEAYNKKKYKKAVDEFENVLNLDKEYNPAIEWLKKANKKYEVNKVSVMVEEYVENGKDYFQNKNFKQAKTYFNKALQLDKGNKEAQKYIKRCNKELAKLSKQERIAKIITEGLIFYRRKKFNNAIAVWGKAKKVDPENKIIDDYIQFAKKAKVESMNKFYNDGVKYYNEGNLLKAKENLEKALQTNPNHSKARKKLSEVKSSTFEIVSRAKKDGKSDYKKGDYEKSIEGFKTVLKFEPDNEEIEDYLDMANKIQGYLSAGQEHLDKGSYIEAIDNFDNVLEYNKNDKNAKDLIKQALLKGKKQASKWFNNGLTFYKNGELKKAASRFSSVLKADPDHSEAKSMKEKVGNEINSKVRSYYKTGLSYYDQKNYKKSIQEFNKILDLKGNYKDTRRLLAKAQKVYNKQTSQQRALSQQKIQGFLFSGIKFYRDGKLKAAISEWNKVLKVYPSHVKAMKYIRRAKYKLSQMEKLK